MILRMCRSPFAAQDLDFAQTPHPVLVLCRVLATSRCLCPRHPLAAEHPAWRALDSFRCPIFTAPSLQCLPSPCCLFSALFQLIDFYAITSLFSNSPSLFPPFLPLSPFLFFCLLLFSSFTFYDVVARYEYNCEFLISLLLVVCDLLSALNTDLSCVSALSLSAIALWRMTCTDHPSTNRRA